jgi:hypothetical protein
VKCFFQISDDQKEAHEAVEKQRDDLEKTVVERDGQLEEQRQRHGEEIQLETERHSAELEQETGRHRDEVHKEKQLIEDGKCFNATYYMVANIDDNIFDSLIPRCTHDILSVSYDNNITLFQLKESIRTM